MSLFEAAGLSLDELQVFPLSDSSCFSVVMKIQMFKDAVVMVNEAQR